MNLKETLQDNGFAVGDLLKILSEYSQKIIVPSHYEEPLAWLDAVGEQDTIHNFINLLDEQRGENTVPEGDNKAGKRKKPATNRQS